MHHICRGLLGTVGTVAREEGAAALWKGLEPGAMLLCNHENFEFAAY